MSEVLSQSQSYIQLEKVMKSSANYSTERDDDREKSKPQHEVTTHAGDWRQEQHPSRDKLSRFSHKVRSKPTSW